MGRFPFYHYYLRMYNQKLPIFSVTKIKQNAEIPKKKYVKYGYITEFKNLTQWKCISD